MHQSVIKVTRWNLKVISLRIPLHKAMLIVAAITHTANFINGHILV